MSVPFPRPALLAPAAGREGQGEKQKTGGIRCTMVTLVTMEIRMHSEMGRLDLEEEEEGGEREGSAGTRSINSYNKHYKSLKTARVFHHILLWQVRNKTVSLLLRMALSHLKKPPPSWASSKLSPVGRSACTAVVPHTQ